MYVLREIRNWARCSSRAHKLEHSTARVGPLLVTEVWQKHPCIASKQASLIIVYANLKKINIQYKTESSENHLIGKKKYKMFCHNMKKRTLLFFFFFFLLRKNDYVYLHYLLAFSKKKIKKNLK